MPKFIFVELKDGEDVKIKLQNKNGDFITVVTVKNRNIASTIYYNSKAISAVNLDK